jgi:hypothetical protein
VGEEEQLESSQAEYTMTANRKSVEEWLMSFLDVVNSPARSERHLNDLIGSLPDENSWISVAFENLALALEWRDKTELPLTISLRFYLRSTQSDVPLQTRTEAELAVELDHVTPPSVIVYRESAIPNWRDGSFTLIKPSLNFEAARRSKAFAQRWFDSADNEYRHNLWFVSSP